MSSNCEAIPEETSDGIEIDSYFNYIAEYIIAKRVGASGKPEYLVKWEGWPTNTATWEPTSNFATPHVVNNFEEFLQEMGAKEPSLEQVLNNHLSGHKVVPKNKKVSEPMSVKLLSDLRKGSNKRKKGIIDLKPDLQKIFDFEVSPKECVAKSQEQPVVTRFLQTKRKWKRVESTPVDANPSVSGSYRSFRYQKRQNMERV